MKVFPSKTFEITFQSSKECALQAMKKVTSNNDGLVSYSTDKLFIGYFFEGGCKVITSKIGIGAFCTYYVNLKEDNKGIIKVEIH